MVRFILILLLTFMTTLGWAYENPPDLTELPIEALLGVPMIEVERGVYGRMTWRF